MLSGSSSVSVRLAYIVYKLRTIVRLVAGSLGSIKASSSRRRVRVFSVCFLRMASPIRPVKP